MGKDGPLCYQRPMWRITARKRVYQMRKQMELGIQRPYEPDRNHEWGGRSFYFFDFDDNLAFLPTPMFLFHKQTGKQVQLSTGEYARYSNQIGREGHFKDYQINLDPQRGSFRRFRDQNLRWWDKKLLRREQSFVEDVERAILRPEELWRGPSWHCFYHAVYNRRPLSIITARGHSAETIKAGIRKFVEHGLLPHEPNYLSVYAVSHPEVRQQLGDVDHIWDVPELKKQAIFHSVQQAFRIYGESGFHRFGMSDDDDQNIERIMEAMRELKRKYPNNSFFVIHSQGDQFTKEEVIIHSRKPRPQDNKLTEAQMSLF